MAADWEEALSRLGRQILWAPKFDRHMPGCMNKVLVGRQQGQIVSPTQLDDQGIDGADLDPSAPADIAQLGGCDVVLPVRRDKGQGLKARACPEFCV
jgi:hypothetical protein